MTMISTRAYYATSKVVVFENWQSERKWHRGGAFPQVTLSMMAFLTFIPPTFEIVYFGGTGRAFER